jgi:glycosyltransferase involved in cell wall biosynthesis
VATDVGAIGEMIQHGETGLLCQPRDIAALTTALHLLLSAPALQRRLGRRARDVAKRVYDPARVATATVNVYRELLGRRAQEVCTARPGQPTHAELNHGDFAIEHQPRTH